MFSFSLFSSFFSYFYFFCSDFVSSLGYGKSLIGWIGRIEMAMNCWADTVEESFFKVSLLSFLN